MNEREELEAIREIVASWNVWIRLDGQAGSPATMLQTGRSLATVVRVAGEEFTDSVVVMEGWLDDRTERLRDAMEELSAMRSEVAELKAKLKKFRDLTSELVSRLELEEGA